MRFFIQVAHDLVLWGNSLLPECRFGQSAADQIEDSIRLWPAWNVREQMSRA